MHEKRQGPLEIDDRYVGLLKLESADYYECPDCKDRIYPLDTARVIESEREKITGEILQAQPLDAFLSAADTAVQLGISRQALHKNKRIRQGFIYRTSLGGLAVYLKKSVDLYRERGDGRFLLSELGYNRSNEPFSTGRTIETVYSVHER
ncbi:MAG: hypothetical protein KKC25_03350 [Proteobacteria bacterium]|nr:hypothetical protein [Pseudomonadota bacterium]